MDIAKIQITNSRIGYKTINNAKPLQTRSYISNVWQSKIPLHDTFCKTSINSAENITAPRRSVNFLGGAAYISSEFETKFTKTFFKKLLREGISDAYSDIVLIPRENVDILKAQGDLNKKSSVAIKALKDYKNQMFPIEKEIFSILETLSKKHPDLTLQELLKLKYPKAEQILIKKQSNILNKINLMIRTLPRKEYIETRKVIQNSFDKIFEPDPIPEERFSRKIFLNELKNLKISNAKLKSKIIKTAKKLPQSSDSINAFIVKYSQPYKLRYQYETEEYIRITRDSEEIGLRLLEPSVGTDDHIHPQTAFRKESEARENGDKSVQDLSTLKVTILTTKRMNNLKTDTPIDKFITDTDINIPTYIQKQISDLTNIANKWTDLGRTQDAATLADYITVLKNEFDARSELVRINLEDFEAQIPRIKERAVKTEEKQTQKRLKKTGHADNSHKEHYIDKDGNIVENRKVQKHISRFKR